MTVKLCLSELPAVGINSKKIRFLHSSSPKKPSGLCSLSTWFAVLKNKNSTIGSGFYVLLFVILSSSIPYPLHVEALQNSSVVCSKWFTADIFCQQYHCSVYNYHVWQLYRCGWSRDIILLLYICTEYTECFWVSCLTLIFSSCHLLFKRGCSAAASVFNISRRWLNWGFLKLLVIKSYQALNLN